MACGIYVFTFLMLMQLHVRKKYGAADILTGETIDSVLNCLDTPSCQTGSEIAISNVTFVVKSGGLSCALDDANCCTVESVDCSFDHDNEAVGGSCNGKALCSPSLGFELVQPPCSGSNTNLTAIDYYCIDASRIQSINTAFSVTQTSSVWHYIRNNNYQIGESIQPGTSVYCMVESDQSVNTVIEFARVHFNLHGSPGNCEQTLTITDSLGVTSIFDCDSNTAYDVTVQTFGTSCVTVKFENTAATAAGYLWLGFRATDSTATMMMTCSPSSQLTCPTTPTTTTTTTTTTTVVLTAAVAAVDATTTMTTPTLSTGAKVVISVVSVIFGLFVIFVIACICREYWSKNHHKNIEADAQQDDEASEKDEPVKRPLSPGMNQVSTTVVTEEIIKDGVTTKGEETIESINEPQKTDAPPDSESQKVDEPPDSESQKTDEPPDSELQKTDEPPDSELQKEVDGNTVITPDDELVVTNVSTRTDHIIFTVLPGVPINPDKELVLIKEISRIDRPNMAPMYSSERTNTELQLFGETFRTIPHTSAMSASSGNSTTTTTTTEQPVTPQGEYNNTLVNLFDSSRDYHPLTHKGEDNNAHVYLSDSPKYEQPLTPKGEENDTHVYLSNCPKDEQPIMPKGEDHTTVVHLSDSPSDDQPLTHKEEDNNTPVHISDHPKDEQPITPQGEEKHKHVHFSDWPRDEFSNVNERGRSEHNIPQNSLNDSGSNGHRYDIAVQDESSNTNINGQDVTPGDRGNTFQDVLLRNDPIIATAAGKSDANIDCTDKDTVGIGVIENNSVEETTKTSKQLTGIKEDSEKVTGEDSDAHKSISLKELSCMDVVNNGDKLSNN